MVASRDGSGSDNVNDSAESSSPDKNAVASGEDTDDGTDSGDVVAATDDLADDDSRPMHRAEQVVELELKSMDDVAKAAINRLESFDGAELHPKLLQAITQIGWKTPTPVQSLCLPYTLQGRDVAGFAQTGTGKTGVFLITTGQRLLQTEVATESAKSRDMAHPRAVVLVPTRELAVQIDQDAQGLFALLGIRSLAVYGGVDYDKQTKVLRDGVDVIVATPGRLKDFWQKKIVSLDKCSIFVCDEADRMFDMGFIEDVEFFLDKLPETTQKLLFSATTNPEVKELAFEYLNTPAYISVSPETITPENIEQHTIICDAPMKLRVMLGMMREHNPECAIIFVNTKLTAEWLHYKLVNNGIDADLITGDLPQKKRISLIQKIKEGKIKALIATDVASRGLHISRITHVYNFDLPDEPANYVHRIGRTARAGAKGSAYSLVCDDYGHNLAAIKDLLGPSLPLNSKWFDEKYMAIEDKAGNPFKDLKIRAPQRDNRDGRGSPRSEERPGGRQGGRKDSFGENRHGRGGREEPRRHDGRPGRDGQRHGQKHGQKHGGGRDQQGQDRNHGERGGRHGGRGGRHHEIPQRSKTGQLIVAEQPKGFFALLKRLIKTIFGRP